MTAVAAPAARATQPRPVPWTRLVWVTWRQHRAALVGVAALLGGLAVYLLIMGLKIHSAYRAAASCHPLGSAICDVTTRPFASYYHTAQQMSLYLQVIPVVVGVFVGAPLLARELETGTFRFAWTQGCGRLRWARSACCSPGIISRSSPSTWTACWRLSCSTCAGWTSRPGPWPPSRSAPLPGC